MQNIFKNWNLLRYFRLAMAIFLLFNAFETRQWWFAIFGLFFLVQALFNFGCASGTCSISDKTKTK